MTDPDALAKARTFPEHYAILAREDPSWLDLRAAVLKLIDWHIHTPKKSRYICAKCGAIDDLNSPAETRDRRDDP